MGVPEDIHESPQVSERPGRSPPVTAGPGTSERSRRTAGLRGSNLCGNHGQGYPGNGCASATGTPKPSHGSEVKL